MTFWPKHRARRNVAAMVLAGLLLLGAGFGVVQLIDYSESYADGASNAGLITEQIQVLALVAEQAGSVGNVAVIRDTGLRAGLRIEATLGRLKRSGLEPALVHELDTRLNEYFASLAIIDQLFTNGDIGPARAASATTGKQIPPITATAHKLGLDLEARAHRTSGVARVGSLSLLTLAVATIVVLTAAVQRRKRREAVSTAQYEARAHFEAMVEHSVDLVLVIDADRKVTYASPALGPMLGYDRDAFVGKRQTDLIHPDDRPLVDAASQRVVTVGEPSSLDFRVRHADGSWRTVEADVGRLADDDVFSVLWTARDVTNQRDMEEQLRRQAFEDSLTGLPNRAVLYDRLGQAMARATRSGGEVAVLLLDLDSFKEINDGFGHPAGDRVLKRTGEALLASVRDGDTVARLGGDEFVIVAEAPSARAVAEDLATRAHAVLPSVVSNDGTDHALDASIGVVVISEAMSVDAVIRDVDLAMYQAKTQGRGRTVFFEAHMLEDAQTRLELGGDLSGALDRGEFELHYQAIYDLTTSQVVGAEALLRWHHPTRGLIAPGVFIPIAERSDAILQIGDWVVREACRQTAAWSRSMHGRIESMHVNVSAHQLTGFEFVHTVADALWSSGIDPHVLVLELTESMLVDDGPAGAETLHALKALGVRIAIDDFGTGYSSLSRLAQLPIDVVKIDRSFVQAAGCGSGSEYRLLGSILTMTQGLRLESVAEGIERQEDLATMLDAGCRLGQGYLLGMPMPALDFANAVDAASLLLA